MRGATSKNTPAARVTSGNKGFAASGCIRVLYQIRCSWPDRQGLPMRWRLPWLMGAGPPLEHEAAPDRAVLGQGLVAICAICRHARPVQVGRNETRVFRAPNAVEFL